MAIPALVVQQIIRSARRNKERRGKLGGGRFEEPKPTPFDWHWNMPKIVGTIMVLGFGGAFLTIAGHESNSVRCQYLARNAHSIEACLFEASCKVTVSELRTLNDWKDACASVTPEP